jgi:hypothetical protein
MAVVFGRRDVWMACDTRVCSQTAVALEHNRQHFVDLKPTEQNVQIRRCWNIAPSPAGVLHLAKPTKEKKNITRPNPLFR